MSEVSMAGGNSNEVHRRGDIVLRSTGHWSSAVAQLLDILEERKVDGVPRHLGFDQDGREMLSFLPGEAAHYPLPEWLWKDDILRDSGRLLRRLHDASADFALSAETASLTWQLPVREPIEVICHNDFAPYNLLFDDERLVGVIDFDTASPGPRVWDLAYLAYRLMPFGEDAGADAPSADVRLDRLDALIESYGSVYYRSQILQTMADRLEALAAFTEGRASETGRSDFAEHAAMYTRDACAAQALALA
ncbi:phosphotransferase enzyme family protein [Leifsonia sp. McL0607]|uniref:phosphotransferase enzyme family protein n=1 Tax=Leifsonia sp. McL0607 TaxID=3415672 RepID=UPI003CE710C5